jgi:hypothetical protein
MVAGRDDADPRAFRYNRSLLLTSSSGTGFSSAEPVQPDHPALVLATPDGNDVIL